MDCCRILRFLKAKMRRIWKIENGILEKIQRVSADLKNQKDQSPSNEEFLKLKAELHACTERLEKVEIASEKCSFCSFV